MIKSHTSRFHHASSDLKLLGGGAIINIMIHVPFPEKCFTQLLVCSYIILYTYVRLYMRMCTLIYVHHIYVCVRDQMCSCAYCIYVTCVRNA